MLNEILTPAELKKLKKHLAEWNDKRKKAGLDLTLSERLANVEMLSSRLDMKTDKEFIKIYLLLMVNAIAIALLAIMK